MGAAIHFCDMLVVTTPHALFRQALLVDAEDVRSLNSGFERIRQATGTYFRTRDAAGQPPQRHPWDLLLTEPPLRERFSRLLYGALRAQLRAAAGGDAEAHAAALRCCENAESACKVAARAALAAAAQPPSSGAAARRDELAIILALLKPPADAAGEIIDQEFWAYRISTWAGAAAGAGEGEADELCQRAAAIVAAEEAAGANRRDPPSPPRGAGRWAAAARAPLPAAPPAAGRAPAALVVVR